MFLVCLSPKTAGLKPKPAIRAASGFKPKPVAPLAFHNTLPHKKILGVEIFPSDSV